MEFTRKPHFSGWQKRTNQKGYGWRSPHGNRHLSLGKSFPSLMSPLTEVES